MAKKHKVYAMYDGQCFYCKKKVPYDLATIEHIVPKSLGGPNKLWNLAICCAKVNNMRGNNPTKFAKTECMKFCPLLKEPKTDKEND